MGWQSFVSEHLAFVLSIVLLGWTFWVLSKVYSFKRQTTLQKAISKPQLRQLRIFLLKGTFFAFAVILFAFWLPTILLAGENIQDAAYSPLFCLIPMILFSFGYLQSEIQFFRLYSYPFTNQMDVPIPPPPKPPPWADKSFEDLSLELEKALEKLKDRQED
ncbi:MAG: hypothetical protein H6657_21435 [Ardenticatenaceae bacterium]|nr:hypothetical protein [Ardenticatenaceae bacterium]